MFSLSYVFTVMPWAMAFEETSYESNYFIIETLIDFLFMLDIIVTFNTAYFNEKDKLVTDRRMIAKRYLKGMLLVDLIAVLPFHLMSGDYDGGRPNAFIRFVRISRISRIFRANRLFKFLRYLVSSERME